jgi:hypothetical protein
MRSAVDTVTKDIITTSFCGATGEHITITFRSPSAVIILGGSQRQQRGVEVSVDWNLTGGARLWSRRYLLGQVPKSACHPDVLLLNDDRIVTSNYRSVWGPWDEFKNTSILQLLQLHPADGGQGIAGKDHALSILVMGDDKYPNRVTVQRDAILRVEYYVSDKRGKRLLKRAKKDRILVRVFLSPAVSARISLFAEDNPATVLFLPLMIVDSKGKDADGVFFVLSAQLSKPDHCKLKQTTYA